MDLRQEPLESIRIRNYDKEGNLMSDETVDVKAAVRRAKLVRELKKASDEMKRARLLKKAEDSGRHPADPLEGLPTP